MTDWISVKERLPPLGATVLLYQSWPKDTPFNCRADLLKTENSIWKGGLIYDGTFVEYHYQYKKFATLKYVTHWMPLPMPPQTVTE